MKNYGKLRTPLRYPGGKFRLSKIILEYIPEHKEFREVMVGGGSVFLRLLERYPEKRYWINDINGDLIAFWRVLKSSSTSLADEAEELKSKYRVNGKQLFHSLKDRSNWVGDFETALRFYILNMISFSGLVDAGGYSQESFDSRFTPAAISRIRDFGDKLKNVKITNKSFEEVMLEPGDDVFLYLDPPYYSQKDSKLYGSMGIFHTSFTHDLLRETLYNCSHKWLLSYDDSNYIRKLYSRKELVVDSAIGHYGMNNVGKDKAPVGRELLIMNYNHAKGKPKPTTTLEEFSKSHY